MTCLLPATATSLPIVSVVVPVRNTAAALERCLRRLNESTCAGFEVIVVDDASTDETPEVARRAGARVLRLERARGPGAARNCGAHAARGEFLVFLDADVCVAPDTIEVLMSTFRARPDVDAVFGSYDTQPHAPNVISQYRNLLHHYFHQTSRELASSFWSGCGAVKRETFLRAGGFRTTDEKPAIEDIEFGVRLRRLGGSIVINKRAQATHLKSWTLWSLFKTDVFRRGVPWTKLLLEEKDWPNDLNLRYSQRVSALLTMGVVLWFVIAAVRYPPFVILPLYGLLLILAVDLWSETRRVPDIARTFAVAFSLVPLGWVALTLGWWALPPAVLIASVVLLNLPLYRFFARAKCPLFAFFVLPLHLLYYGFAVTGLALGVCSHALEKCRALRPSRVADPLEVSR